MVFPTVVEGNQPGAWPPLLRPNCVHFPDDGPGGVMTGLRSPIDGAVREALPAHHRPRERTSRYEPRFWPGTGDVTLNHVVSFLRFTLSGATTRGAGRFSRLRSG